MYKRHNTRYDGQKRVAVGRTIRDNELSRRQGDGSSSRNSTNEEAFDNGSDSNKLDHSFSGTGDPTVPAIQMDDSIDQSRVIVIFFFYYYSTEMIFTILFFFFFILELNGQ